MPILYDVPAQVTYKRALALEDLQLGRDVYFRADFAVSPARDYVVIAGTAAARQSVEREGMASPGDLPTSPTWGFGLRALQYRPDSKSSRDEIAIRVRARLAANPRIQSVDDVRVFRDTATDALVTTVAATVAGRTAAGRIDDRIEATIAIGGHRE